jgi:hypothetical protein
MRGNPKDDLHRANQILGDCARGGYSDDAWCGESHVEPKDAKWLLDLVEELLTVGVPS